jgi:hypothetical protein
METTSKTYRIEHAFLGEWHKIITLPTFPDAEWIEKGRYHERYGFLRILEIDTKTGIGKQVRRHIG